MDRQRSMNAGSSLPRVMVTDCMLAAPWEEWGRERGGGCAESGGTVMEVSGEGRELCGARGVLVMGERKSTSEASWPGDPGGLGGGGLPGRTHTRTRMHIIHVQI